jgi:type IV pilus assembly protein PilE
MRNPTSQLRSRGFTLIELMIVVAIVAILASIAYPAYTDSVLKGKRAQARTALLELMQQQERYMTQNNTYLAFTNTGGTTVPANASSIFKVFSGDNPSGTAYRLSAGKCTRPGGGEFDIKECVLLSAAPTGTDAAVGTLSLSSSGVKACSGTAASTNKRLCWP